MEANTGHLGTTGTLTLVIPGQPGQNISHPWAAGTLVILGLSVGLLIVLNTIVFRFLFRSFRFR